MFEKLNNNNSGGYSSVRFSSNKLVLVPLLLVLIFLLVYSYTLNSTWYSSSQKTFVSVSEKELTNHKLIYLWNTFWRDPKFEFGLGSEPFRRHNCSFQDCVILYDGAMKIAKEYDAVVFHAPEFTPYSQKDLPVKASLDQRFVFFSMESPLTRPVSKIFNGFYNWTMSYRIDSDVLVMYFAFYCLETGLMVSHSDRTKWREKTVLTETLDQRRGMLATKEKPVAWFVSNCNSKNKRMLIKEDLRNHIQVDVYGKCGELSCSHATYGVCNEMLRKTYFFYLAFENSNCEDYVTEKLATAMTNDVIPIYYGGANLTKFLPPHSYIDASTMTAKELADKINHLMTTPEEYLEYFWWKDFYRIRVRSVASYKPFCKLCELLHDPHSTPKTYDDFDKWWTTYEGRQACNDDS